MSQSLPILEVKYVDPLFQMRLHPTKPLFYSGLGNGYIYCHSYKPEELQRIVDVNKRKYEQSDYKGDVKVWTCQEVGGSNSNDKEDAPVKVVWKTKRHKGSVRSLCLDNDGSFIYSIGTDNVLKKAVADTGSVVKKISLKDQTSSFFTKMIKSPTHPCLILGDENGNVIVMNSETLRVTNKVVKIHNSDAINEIFQFSKRSVHKYISLGQTTLAYWDCRESNESDFDIKDDDEDTKRKVLLSDDQEDELLCGTFVDPEVADTVVCGMGEGILTVWKPKKNDLEDQVNRIKICKEESIDCIVPTLQDDNCVWCGCSNGKIYKVNVKSGRIVEIRKHSSLDEVAFLDLDFEYRIVSGGMDKLLLWEAQDEEAHDSDFKDSDSSVSKDSDGDQSEDYNDESDVWEGFEDIKSDVIVDSDIDSDVDSDAASDSDTEKSIGLSREEILAELSKDLSGEDEPNVETPTKRAHVETNKDSNKRKDKKRKLPVKKAINNSHGITKFDDL